jgi:parallel beta-helix repeat protein
MCGSASATETTIIDTHFADIDGFTTYDGSFDTTGGILTSPSGYSKMYQNYSTALDNNSYWNVTLGYINTSSTSDVLSISVYDENPYSFSGSRNTISLRIESSSWKLYRYDTFGTLATLSDFSTLTDGSEHEIIVNIDNQTFTVYLDGSSVGSSWIEWDTDSYGISIDMGTGHGIDYLTVNTTQEMTYDGTDGVQALVDAAEDGDTIVLESREYTFIDDYVKIYNRSNITIVGAGIKNTIINYTTPNTVDFAYGGVFSINGSYNISIDNLTIKCDSLPSNYNESGLWVNNAYGGTFSNLWIESFNSGLFYVNNVRYTDIYNCVLTYSRRNLFLFGNSGHNYNNTIRNNVVNHSTAWMGIDLNSGNHWNIVENNTVHANANSGIKVYSASYGNTFRNNTVYNNENGFVVMGGGGITGHIGEQNIIENNSFYDNSVHGILITGPYSNNNTVIRYNLIRDNDGDGINVAIGLGGTFPSDTYYIYNNLIYNNSNDGIFNSRTDSDIFSYNNIIMDNAGYAFNQTASGTTNITSIYNDIFQNGGMYSGTIENKTGDIFVNPLFVDEANGDFNLSTSSPLIAAGLYSLNLGLYPYYPKDHGNEFVAVVFAGLSFVGLYFANRFRRR